MAQRTRESWNEWQEYNGTCNCDSCWWFDTEAASQLKLAEHGFAPLYRKLRIQWLQNCPKFGHLLKKTTHRGNGAPKGMFAGTLTVSSHDPYNEEDMIQAIRKVFKGQRTCPVKRFSWYLEYTEANLPHIHFIYETPHGGRIPAKLFKRAWPIWDEKILLGAGHRGGYHKVVADEEGYLKYISKDKGRHETVWPMD